MTVVVSLPAIVICRAALPSNARAAAAVSLLVTDRMPGDESLLALVDPSVESLRMSFSRFRDCGLDARAICWLAAGESSPEWLDVRRVDVDHVEVEMRGYYPEPSGLLLWPVMPV